jgi:Tol biopolymer transport system component
VLPCLGGTASGEIAFGSTHCEQGGVDSNGWYVRNACVQGLWRMHDDGSHRQRITNGVDDASTYEPGTPAGDGDPSWSPGGRHIVFARGKGNFENKMMMVNADGSGLREVNPALDDRFVAVGWMTWAPTGGHIAFVADQGDVFEGERHGTPMFVMNEDGTGAHQVTPDGWEVDTPDFTPDGKHIVYFGFPHPSADDALVDAGLYETDLDGSYQRQLTFQGDLLIAANGVALSPDGEYLAFTRKGGLYTLRLSDGDVVNRSRTDALTPTWSPNGPTIFFNGYPDKSADSEAFYSVDLSGRNGERVVASHDWIVRGAEWGDASDSTGFDPVADGAPPVTVTGNELPSSAPAGSASVRAAHHVTLSRIPFLVADASGIRRIEASVGRHGERGCRFARSDGTLRHRSRCSHPRYFRVSRNVHTWRKITARLPKGTYHVRFRTTDVKGHTARHPTRHVVHLH